MHTPLQQAITHAYQQAEKAAFTKDSAAAYAWLERAHILTQRQPLLHAKAHWKMLTLGWQTADYREMAGQVPRIFAALLFSKIWVPLGNTGRSRVSAFRPMPISEELHALLQNNRLPPSGPSQNGDAQ